jgi:hypothetical protein
MQVQLNKSFVNLFDDDAKHISLGILPKAMFNLAMVHCYNESKQNFLNQLVGNSFPLFCDAEDLRSTVTEVADVPPVVAPADPKHLLMVAEDADFAILAPSEGFVPVVDGQDLLLLPDEAHLPSKKRGIDECK